MQNKEELCEKIRSLYPDIGECGMDLNVDYDNAQKMWVVDLKKDNQNLKHYLDENDANLCLDGKQCVSLGLEIAQFKENLSKES